MVAEAVAEGTSVDIKREVLTDALGGHGVGSTEVIAKIREALAEKERVIVWEPDGVKSLLEDDGKGGFKTTPIEPRK